MLGSVRLFERVIVRELRERKHEASTYIHVASPIYGIVGLFNRERASPGRREWPPSWSPVPVLSDGMGPP